MKTLLPEHLKFYLDASPVAGEMYRLGGEASRENPEGRWAGAHPLPRPQTHLRDFSTTKRSRHENNQQYAGTLRRRFHPPYLHPRHQTAAESSGGDNGEFYGADHVNPPQKAQKSQAGR